MTKGIYEFNADFGRMGDISGMFVANSEEVQSIIGKEIYFGECLGKHSDVYCTINESQIRLLTDDQDFITKFETILGSGTISGYSPFDYIDEDLSDDDS